jgi:hypothetical protein
MKQEYAGCRTLREINRLPSENVDPETFFDEYIATRTPVQFDGFLAEADWKVSKDRWTIDYLKQHTPDTMKVKVEYRNSESDRFGLGKERKISFHQFLSDIDEGATNLYMTTQELEYDLEDHPEVISAPLTALTDDFPFIPKLFGNLIVSNINLWMGRSSTWTTSGLHHDYHDNLYIMLKGQKQITLISPAFAENLYTVGELDIVYPNGRINYVGQPTFADGRSLEADKAWTAAQKLKQAISDAKSSRHSGGKRFGNQSSISQEDDEDEGEEEDDIDLALEEVLEAEHDDFDEEAFDEDEDGDFDETEDSNFDDEGSDEDDASNESNDLLTGKRSLTTVGIPQNKRQRVSHEVTTTSSRPDNFSNVDTSLSPSQLKDQFPQYLEAAKSAITVTLKEGEMLFIPAGWFHEVKSQGSEGHMAFNYWFHPPDQLENFEKPYVSDFWPSVLASKLQNK